MYKVQNISGRTELLLYSLIWDGQTASQVISELPPEGPIKLRINSDGGDVFEAIALYNYLKDRNVTVVIDGICASAASIVACCGLSVTMKTGSMMMLHQPVTGLWGNAEELREAAGILDKIGESILDIYQARTRLSREKLKELINAGTWLTAEECLAYNFCDDLDPGEISDLEAERKTYEDGIHEERQRLYALDELAAPGRENILRLAKYKDIRTAQDVAVEILKMESVRPPAVSAYGASDYDGAISLMVEAIKQKRRLRA